MRAAPATVWPFLDRRGITFKKKTAHASEQDREDAAAARKAWQEAQPELDLERLIFIDESGLSAKLARLRGRAAKGERCWASIPHGHWHTTTFVAGLRTTGLDATMLLDGPMNANGFRAYSLTPRKRGSSRCLCPHCLPAIRSSWTTCRRARSAASVRRSRQPAPHCSICRPTRQI
ncbi:MAG: hypothetical protein HC850_04460 [Rhodomicrobium sp.]|nr:hypothetical protein [Rhodomicrobium sp.]